MPLIVAESRGAPFSAETRFSRNVFKFDIPWEAAGPMPLEDPNSRIMPPVDARSAAARFLPE